MRATLRFNFPGGQSPVPPAGHIDRCVAWRLKRLLIKRNGRNLRAVQGAGWTEDWLWNLGLHRLPGTIRSPGTA